MKYLAVGTILHLATLTAAIVGYTYPPATCGIKGALQAPYRISQSKVTDFHQCTGLCYSTPTCSSYSVTTANVCNLYSASIAAMGFKRTTGSTSFYDKGCYSRLAGPFILQASQTGDPSLDGKQGVSGNNDGATILFYFNDHSRTSQYTIDGSNLRDHNGHIYVERGDSNPPGVTEFQPAATINQRSLSVLSCRILNGDELKCTAPTYPGATLQIDGAGGFRLTADDVGAPAVLQVLPPSTN